MIGTGIAIRLRGRRELLAGMPCVLAVLLLAWAGAVSSAAGEAAAPAAADSRAASRAVAGGGRPLLGALVVGVAPSATANLTGESDPMALAPLPHFGFGEVQVATGLVRPAGRENRALGVPLTAHQTAVARRAIQPNQTPKAVPHTPITAYQTAAARRAIQPSQTPNAALTPLATALPSATTTPVVTTPFVAPAPLP